MFRFHAEMDGVVDRLNLPVSATAADHEVVRVADRAPQIELDGVQSLPVGCVLGCRGGDLFRRHSVLLPPYSPCSSIYAATASGTRYRIGSPARARWRTELEEMLIVGMG